MAVYRDETTRTQPYDEIQKIILSPKPFLKCKILTI